MSNKGEYAFRVPNLTDRRMLTIVQARDVISHTETILNESQGEMAIPQTRKHRTENVFKRRKLTLTRFLAPI